MASASLLQKVAAHEVSLVQSREEATANARKKVDAAQAEAATIMQAASNALDVEIGNLRKEAAAKRVAEREAIEKASEEKVAQIRKDSAGRLEAVQAALLERILPG